MPPGPVLSEILLSFFKDYSINPIDRPNCTLFHNLLLVVVISARSRVAIVDTFGEPFRLTE
jgi:hypothetical protein